MDASDVFRHIEGLGTYQPRFPQGYHPPGRPAIAIRDEHRKTRCDPTLPRCLPCERSGSVCEYFDTTKGKKISRYYVVKLQARVRALEAELGQYTDEDSFPQNNDDIVAMTRILMEEAKRYTDSQHISQLIPGVRGRRQAAVGGPGHTGLRSQSFSIPPPMMSRKKSYPMISSFPADTLPSRAIADKLVEVYCQRGQILTPTLHENRLASDLDDVYNGSQDAYQHFVIRMVMAISMQKLDTTYAGLADSYYLAAMQRFEEVLGLADEKTIAMGTEDPLTLDMRRRLSWTITAFEFGLASSMGRPNGFAKSDDLVDVKFFESAKDENITEHGILQGPADEKKLIAIHFCKMRLCQSEIKRVLYEKKQPEPRDERHPWFAAMETKLDQWLDASPASPAWCKPWFTGKYHTMVISLHRPSPQVPKPSSRSAVKCFDSAAFIIDLSSKQMMAAAVDITWVFVFTLYMALNTILWSVAAYPDVRGAHSRDEVEELVNVALDILDQCAERWPGISAASELYSTFSKACLRSYEARHTPVLSASSTFGTPSSQQDMNSPSASDNSSATTVSRQGPTNGVPAFNPPQFGYVFDTAPEQVSFDNPFAGQPTFRSNSIFHNPAPSDPSGRRFSYFPPEFTQSNENLLLEESTPPESDTNASPPLLSPPNHLPTPA
ncbi:fungal specific transcription factor domain-containing protein [Apiospora hydei]|uniref:Fungal specific transcription factor domain-containing protein n=1 Tax=Apiospora hydei TaxID=1337664 RepID=A0ABR1WQ69_9PEZI